MKVLLSAVLSLLVSNAYAAPLLNASSQGQDTCGEAVAVYADLILGKSNPTVSISSNAIVSGNNETTSLDTQKFFIHYRNGQNKYKITVRAYGPDSKDRCMLERL